MGQVKPPPDTERLPWTGELPGVQECIEFGWFARFDRSVGHYVACAADHADARPDLNRLLKEAVWDRKLKRFVQKGHKARPKEKKQKPTEGQ
jgi:hypothetical protein